MKVKCPNCGHEFEAEEAKVEEVTEEAPAEVKTEEATETPTE